MNENYRRTNPASATLYTGPLDDANVQAVDGLPQIADSAKALALILVGPEGDVDRATLDLAKLPAALPLLPPPPTTPR